MKDDGISVALREPQWDLIVLALQEVQQRATPFDGNTPMIDKLARKFIIRRCKEIVASIQDAVPSAGAESKGGAT